MKSHTYMHVRSGDKVSVNFADIDCPMLQIEVREPNGLDEGAVVALFFKGHTAKDFVRTAKLALSQLENYIRREEGKNGISTREEGKATVGNGR